MINSTTHNPTTGAGWTTLDELREFVLSNGWFPGDFECAIDAVGADPQDVADRSQLIEFQDVLHTLRTTALERRKIDQFNMFVDMTFRAYTEVAV